MPNYRLALFFAISCILRPTVSSSILDTIKMKLYLREPSYNDPGGCSYKEVYLVQAVELDNYMDLQETTLIHFHGYEQSTDTDDVVNLVHGYVKGTNYNVIAVDYRVITHLDYIRAVLLVDDVATIMVQSINDMVAGGMNETKLVLSGFSLGSQVCGSIGRKLPFKLPKIIEGVVSRGDAHFLMSFGTITEILKQNPMLPGFVGRRFIVFEIFNVKVVNKRTERRYGLGLHIKYLKKAVCFKNLVSMDSAVQVLSLYQISSKAGDPAGEGFYFLKQTISASDALCVQCIHTDMGKYGHTGQCGHLDFYPNGGVRQQPGCPAFPCNIVIHDRQPPLCVFEEFVDPCSHNRADKYMAEAARHSDAFPSVQCDSWGDFEDGNCNWNVTIPMGYAAPCSVTGKFYLRTNFRSPFGKGLNGTVYRIGTSV